MAVSSAHGFTLPELVATLAVAGTLMFGAANAIPYFLHETRMVTAVNEFVTTLNFGRSQAIRRVRQVVLCPSRDRQNCSNSSAWPQGWLLFESRDRELDPGDTLMRVGQAQQHGIGLTASNYRKRIAWQPLGTSGGSNASFTFCSSHAGVQPRVICLSNTGRPRVSRTRCDGKPVICP